MSNQGKLLVVSGFSGAGKGTVMKKLMESYDNYALSISATTRSPREGEVDGREYFFKSEDEFKKMIDGGELLEYAKYVGNYYGTPKKYVESCLDEGKNVILEIESVGALNVKKIFPEAVLIFIVPPSADELERRLRGRGTEDEETIMARLSKASKESFGVEKYDYIVVNDTVDECVGVINSITLCDENTCDLHKASNNIKLINEIREQLKVYSGGEN